MLFHQWSFLFVFLPVTLAVTVLLPARLRNGWLLAASLLFYGATNLGFLPVLVASTFLDYGIGARLDAAGSARGRRRWLVASIVLNLGILGWFKYAGLITETVATIPGLEGFPIVEAALPVGISFYTFQSMSYSIDLYRGLVQRSRSWVDFGCYVTLFPQLVAGPIVRYSELASQLRNHPIASRPFADGVSRFSLGLAKKILLADTAATLADPLFAAGDPTCIEAWCGITLYAAQIYFDFSGYSDMAIGLGRMLGFTFPENFDSPYKARSVADFWRRWHITLSRWLRDNLYIPLGGNRGGTGRLYRNLCITMLLGGLWHGASWNFVIWGGLWGVALAAERTLGDRNPLLRAHRVVQIAAVFLVTLITWVFFRVEALPDAAAWLGAMFAPSLDPGSTGWRHGALLLGLYAIVWGTRNLGERTLGYGWGAGTFRIACFVASLAVAYGREISPFLYFRF